MAAFTFNPADLQRLSRLTFLPRQTSNDIEAGARRSRRGGDGGDFLDYRAYIAGDDVRNVDWNVYGRLRQLVVRLNESPRQVAVNILIDTSRSMGFGDPVTKLEQAQRITCALGFVAMRGGDRVFVNAFGAQSSRGVGPLKGARGLASLVTFLTTLDANGESDLAAAVQRLRAERRHRGIVIIVSDLLNVPQLEEMLGRCAASGAIVGVQCLDRIDRGHGLKGKVRLRDSETGAMVDVDLDSATLAEYQRSFDLACDRQRAWFSGPRRHYIRIDTNENYLKAVCDALRTNTIAR